MTEDVARSWAEWDAACREDDARNGFVVPLVVSHLERSRPGQVIDIGAGSGHIAGACIATSATAAATSWLLVDRDDAAIALLRERFADAANVQVLHGAVPSDHLPTTQSSALVVLTYTLLEMSLGELGELLSTMTEGDSLIIVQPDVLEDVSADHEALDGFRRHGTWALDKVDRFTCLRYPFHAHRFEVICEHVTASGGAILAIDSYVDTRTRRHFGLVARW